MPKRLKNGKEVFTCTNDHEQGDTVLKPMKEVLGKNIKKIEVADINNTQAVYDFECEKCGHPKAQFIEIFCAYSDEDNIYRFKCPKCGFVKQLEGKVT